MLYTERLTEGVQDCIGVTVARSDDGEKMTVNVVNNSDGAMHVNGYHYILFDGAGQPVVIGYSLLTGENADSHEMQPGETFSDEKEFYRPCESVSVYIDGYMEKPAEKQELDFGSIEEILGSMMNDLVSK